MVRRTEMSLITQKRELEKLIEDAEKINFNEDLINDYKRQLKGVDLEIIEGKERMKQLKEGSK